MALQKTVKTLHGFTAENAYHKIDNVRIINKESMTFDVKVCKSKNETIAFDTLCFQCMYELDKENPIKQAYLYLKTRSEFVDSTDC